MDATYLLGVVLGITGALLMNVGKGVQKQAVHVFREGRAMFSPEHRRTLTIWGVGLAMTASATVPYNLALMFANSPSTISAMTGIGLLGLAVYATRVIGERLSLGDAIGIAAVLLGTMSMSWLGSAHGAEVRGFEVGALLRVNGVILATGLVACSLALVVRRIHGLAFGLTAGLLVGTCMFMADVGLVRAGGSFSGQFAHPYVYVAIGYGVAGLVVTQLGFLRARALEVVPTINAVIILAPMGLEWVIYGTPMPAERVGMVLLIVVGVVLLSVGAGSGEYAREPAEGLAEQGLEG